jgi:methylated-DNA-[protein]-cysteine S-methyltransferase
MTASGLAQFETGIGRCGIAWRDAGLVGIHLPERGEQAFEESLRRRFHDLRPASPPLWVENAIAGIQRLLAGEKSDLAEIPLDFGRVAPFEASVYRAARDIPAGSTITYGELARRIGDGGDARAIGQALGRNPWPIVVPCHRITAADGRAGGFSAPGGRATKLRLLEIEGALALERLPLFAPPTP